MIPIKRQSTWLLPVFSLAVLFLALLPLLAKFPQSGDGIEVVMTAVNGGVLHPPGFPLQAWLSRLFVLLPFGSPVERIALLSGVSHALTAYFIGASLLMLNTSSLIALVGAAAYAFFPRVWYTGVTAEVFALTYLMISIVVWQTLKLLKSRTANEAATNIVLMAVFTALALSQHPIALTALALPIIAFVTTIKRFHILPVAIGSTILGIAILISSYFSLFLFVDQVLWPDWGKLESIKDLIRHVSRSEYGVFSLAAENVFSYLKGTDVLLADLLVFWNVLLLFIIFSFRKEKSIIGIILNCIFALCFLYICQIRDLTVLPLAILDRFQGCFLVPAAILLGFGLNELSKQSKKLKDFLPLLVLVFVLIQAAFHYKLADARSDNTAEVYRNAISSLLPDDAIYLASQDLEIFGGVRAQNGLTRFPIAIGIFHTWYTSKIAQRIDQRIGGVKKIAELPEFAKKYHYSIYTTNSELVKNLSKKYFRDSLFFVISERPPYSSNSEVIARLRSLCHFSAQLAPLPKHGHYYSWLLIGEFAEAFEVLSKALKPVNPYVGKHAFFAAQAIAQAKDKNEWIKECQLIEKALTPRR